MESALGQWLSQHQSLCLITLALFVERWLRIPNAWHPMVLVRSLANQLALKVHHPERHEPSQQRVAGILASAIMLVLCVPLPILLREFSPLPFLVDGLILLCCLSWRPMATQLGQLSELHPEQQKQLRRSLLGHWLARDCSRLSPLGIHKGAIEAIYLRSWHDQVAILFWYLLLGSWAVLIYRILLELSRAWHPKKQNMADFGQFIKQVRALLDFGPQLLWSGWLLFTTFRYTPKENWQLAKQFESKPRGFSLLAATAQHKCDLGGPALYDGVKFLRPRLAGQHPPQSSEIKTALQSINLRMMLLLALIWLIVLTQPIWLP